ncbi:MAG TPA: Ig-like domain-containing protein [Methylomirabilota bacterium]|nr:Ig-like domain-containing protein [Methylomirabilota bacterium]
MVDYSPERGAIEVSTAAPIRIAFDHDVDKSSVESRLSLLPATDGSVVWLGPRSLEYKHATLQPSKIYEVILLAGYKDVVGNAYALRHHWTFTTEGPPSVASSAPANNESDVDPASYLSIDFTREMDASTLGSAITIEPSIPFSVRLDPADAKRAVVAPDLLLDPSTTYTVDVSTAALDAHGNQLYRNQSFVFTTGPSRPLRHWVAFATALADGSSGGVWIVNESGFPRRVFDGPSVHSFSWSPDGSTLLIQGDSLSWSAFTPSIGSRQLPFKAAWAAALAAGLGYVYIDVDGTLHRLSVDGADEVIASNVSDAASAPNGLRVAYVRSSGSVSTVWGYDVGLRSRYELVTESGLLSDLSWSPTGNRIAYLREDSGGISLRVRSFTGQAATTTVASGDIGHPTWLPDSTHIVFAAGITTASGQQRKAFLVNAIAPPASLTAALAIPSPPIEVADPVPSPDGHQIAFVSQNQVWMMNADGTRPTALTRFDAASFPYSCLTPAWTRL